MLKNRIADLPAFHRTDVIAPWGSMPPGLRLCQTAVSVLDKAVSISVHSAVNTHRKDTAFLGVAEQHIPFSCRESDSEFQKTFFRQSGVEGYLAGFAQDLVAIIGQPVVILYKSAAAGTTDQF